MSIIRNSAGRAPASAASGSKARVITAREHQKDRFKKAGRKIVANSEMNVKDLGSLVKLPEKVRDILDDSAERLSLSARAYHRVVKIARTIADLDNSTNVEAKSYSRGYPI